MLYFLAYLFGFFAASTLNSVRSGETETRYSFIFVKTSWRIHKLKNKHVISSATERKTKPAVNFYKALKKMPLATKYAVNPTDERVDFIQFPDVASEEVEVPIDKAFADQIAIYNSKLKADPGDKAIWIEYIAFQDQLSRMGKNLASHIANKKLSIYEAAIKHFPHDAKLLGAYLDCAEDTLDGSELLPKWVNVIPKMK